MTCANGFRSLARIGALSLHLRQWIAISVNSLASCAIEKPNKTALAPMEPPKGKTVNGAARANECLGAFHCRNAAL